MQKIDGIHTKLILMASVSLDTLPIELVYHICRNLDIRTILFSLRNVCKRFYTIINNYNQYELDLSSISKNEFHRICQIIDPKNVTSLILSDGDMTPGQIDLFISIFNINEFIHLRSLTLMNIEKSELNLLMENINTNYLSSLSINIRKNNSKTKDTSISTLLSSILIANLHKLDLRMWNHEINNFVWPKNHTLQYLTLGHYVTVKQICNILSQLSHLRTLVLRNCIINDIDGTINTLSDIQTNTYITSLIFINSRLQMNELIVLLLLTPSLVHLQLTGSVNSSDPILDGSQWENFIQSKLPLLKRFEFFFRAKIDSNSIPINIESWIVPFQTPFWLEHKSWFVTCNYIIKTSTFRLYSIPICDSCITYESDFDKITCTTCTTINSDTSMMNNIREVHMDLPLMMNAITTQKVC